MKYGEVKTNINNQSFSGTMVFVECGLLDEKEFAAWVGLSPNDKDLNGKKGKDKEIMPVKTVDESGHCKEFYLVSLEGLQPGDIFSMRRTQFQYYVDIVMDEHHVQPSTQLSRDQPKNWFEFASKAHGAKHRGMGGEKQDRKPTIHSLSLLMEKASAIVSRRESAEVVPQEPGDSQDSQAYADELDALDAEKEGGPQHAQLQDESMLLGSGANPGKGPAPKKTARTGKKKALGDDDDDMEIDSVAGSSARMVELTKNDPEMSIVAQRHEKITGRSAPKCFENLQVKDVFVEGSKIKQNMYGARALIMICF